MARPLRLEFPGAVYHVTARGHERGVVFRSDEDRKTWLDLLAKIAFEQSWRIHAYCLMSNHYHLLIETPRGGLSAGMRSLNGRYGQWFNRRHSRHGHLFEGRFKAVLVQKESHLVELSRYIVLNPIRARLASRPGDWPWSSYRATSGQADPAEWLEVDWTLGHFAKSRSMARAAYRRFVRQGKRVGSPLDAVRGQIYLGDAVFLAEMDQLLADQPASDEIPARQRQLRLPTIDAVKQAVAREWRVSPEALSRSRGGEDKIAAIYLARKLTGLRGREIGAAFGVKPARVSNAVRAIEESEDAALKRKIDRLAATLARKSG